MRRAKHLLHRLADDSGQTLIIAAVCMVVVVSFLGLAIDVGQLRLAKRNLQNAADAAALAGGLEIRVCGIIPNCPAMQAAAQNALVENGMAGASFITNCGTAGAGLTLILNSPPCALGASDPNNGSSRYVEAVVSQKQRTHFGRFLGFDNIQLSARAEATRKLNAPCIYALDPAASSAISVLVGLGINSTCGVVDESSSGSALTCIVGAAITAPSINVTGGTAGLLCGLSTPARTGVAVPNPADPLAYLSKPVVGACGTTTSSPYTGAPKQVAIAVLGGTKVFNPGVYCGGISISVALATNITFNPGVYILKQGVDGLGFPAGGMQLNLNLLSTITGTGVTFYNVGPVGNFSITPLTPLLSLSNINLSAPTTGNYGGVLFFQDAADTSAGSISASLISGSKLEGAIYLPGASVDYGVSAVAASYNILVAKQIHFNVALLSVFGNNYAALASGSPLNDGAVLIQ